MEEARSAFQAVLQQDPKNETALLWLGYIADDPLTRLSYTTQAMEAHPQSPRTRAAVEWAWQNKVPPTRGTPRPKRVGAQTPRDSQQTQYKPLFGLVAMVVVLAGTLFNWPSSLPAHASVPAAEETALAELPSPEAVRRAPTQSVTDHPSWTSLTTTPFSNPNPSPIPLPSVTLTPLPVAPAAVSASGSPTYTIPAPTPVPLISVAGDVVNILVLGSDRRPDWTEWHTDAIHIVSIQKDHAIVSVISIPRDLYLYIPGLWMTRINLADYYGEAYSYPGGGGGLLRDTLRYNLGIRIDYVVRTNFDGLIGIVNTLGGVDIPVHCYLSDYWPYADESGQYPILAMEPGIHHMDGETALWYARSRKTTSVFSRERRQQQVLLAIFRKAKSLAILPQLPTLWSQSQEMIQTDMTFADILSLARMGFALEDQELRFYNIGPNEVTPWTTPFGGAVFRPNWETMAPLLTEAMSPPSQAREVHTRQPVEVWNGTTNADWDWLAADRLLKVGFPITIGTPDRQDYAETQLVIYSGSAKGTGMEYLQQMFNIPESRITYQPSSPTTFGFRLILGADYQTCPE